MMGNWDVTSGTIFLTIFIFGLVGMPLILSHCFKENNTNKEHKVTHIDTKGR